MVTKRQVKSKKSKRIPTHKKMKLDKKIQKAKKKMRKQFKKNKQMGLQPMRKKEKNDIPDGFPNKNEFLKNLIEFKKEQKVIND